MVEALERGELSFAFLDLPVWDRFSGLSQQSFREVSSQEAIPLELLMVVREAIGFAQADPDDRMREDELRGPRTQAALRRARRPGLAPTHAGPHGTALGADRLPRRRSQRRMLT
jgi:hypothetical protein